MKSILLKNNLIRYIYLLIKILLNNKFVYFKIFITLPVVLVLPIVFMSKFLNMDYSMEAIIKTIYWSYFYFVLFEVIIYRMSYLYNDKLNELIFSNSSIIKIIILETTACITIYIPSLIISLGIVSQVITLKFSYFRIIALLGGTILSLYIFSMVIYAVMFKWRNSFHIINSSIDVIQIFCGILYPVSMIYKPLRIFSYSIPLTHILMTIDAFSYNIILNFLVTSTVWVILFYFLLKNNIKKYKESGNLYD